VILRFLAWETSDGTPHVHAFRPMDLDSYVEHMFRLLLDTWSDTPGFRARVVRLDVQVVSYQGAAKKVRVTPALLDAALGRSLSQDVEVLLDEVVSRATDETEQTNDSSAGTA